MPAESVPVVAPKTAPFGPPETNPQHRSTRAPTTVQTGEVPGIFSASYIPGARSDDGARQHPGKSKRARVLYVDDEVNLCRAMERIFSVCEDVTLEAVTSPHEGLERLRRQSYAVVVTDLRMPEMDGIEFLVNAKRIRPEARRMMISGYADFETAMLAINRIGVDRLLTKPWNMDELLQAVQASAEHVALLQENARIQEELRRKATELHKLTRYLDRMVEERTDDLLGSLISALDLRDSETQWHSRRVGLYARRLAVQMGLDSKEIDDIERGALLHDIGKIGVRDAVLLKPGPLTDEEWVEMKRHPALGYEMLKNIGFLQRARLIPLHHQERFDGEGYPAQLQGNEIYVGARIFSVVDTFDAITSNRPYRRAASYANAIAEIDRCSGTQFDPAVVDAFKQVPREDWQEIRRDLEAQGATD